MDPYKPTMYIETKYSCFSCLYWCLVMISTSTVDAYFFSYEVLTNDRNWLGVISTHQIYHEYFVFDSIPNVELWGSWERIFTFFS